MDIEERIAEAEKLIAQRREIDAKLVLLFGGQEPERKLRLCGNCGKPGHTARSCPEPLRAIAAE